ncbi:hypothetical protein BJY01DRAFT_249856 [Aspergillus pseudoustus]|uniref:FAD-binding domain-containing protein n=1 Tax=Aspergillus pseudoustus TaxID=1810923 RepID=A0ABR4JL72_9EURO
MPLRVAIIGAGVGGLTLAVSLQANSNLDVQVYERATELKEIGALVGVGPNALRTLGKLGVPDVLTDEVGWRSPSGIPMIFKHWQTGELLSIDQYHNVPDHRHHYARMHRAKLQQALLKRVSRDIIHLGKKADSVKVIREEGVTVKFTDGTSIKADVVIGADGIKSKIRHAFVPDHQLTWLGEVVLRSTFDYSLVEDIKEIPQDSSHFSGPNGFFFGTRLGSMGFGVTASFPVDPKNDDKYKEPVWNAPASVDTLRERFKDWAPVVPKIIERVPWVRQYANVAGAELEQWSFEDRVTLLGDAAHTHGGAFAAGVGLAIDDAYALGLAFEHVLPSAASFETLSPPQIREIFDLYETTRRPHTGKVLAVVHESRAKTADRLQKFFTGQSESDEDFRYRLTHRGDPVWVNEHDVEATFKKVLENRTKGQAEPSQGQVQEQSRL